MATPASLHDRFFRNAFAREEVSQPFFERYLPTEIESQLDFTTLGLAKESFIDETLKAHHTDLLFTIQTRDAKPLRLYLLMEHKSFDDPWVGLQLQGYVVNVWEHEKKQLRQPPLPMIYPLVLYHGDRAWSGGSNIADLLDIPESMQAFAPHYPFSVCDLSQDQLDGLQQRAWLAITLQVLKYARSDELRQRLPEIFGLFQTLLAQRDTALAYLETVLRYLAQAANDLDEATLREALVQTLPSDVGDQVMPTLAETWLEQGRQQGATQGHQQGEISYARRILRQLLEQQFGELSPAILARIEQADLDTLDAWVRQVPSAQSLTALFPDA